ncbi:MAG: DUF1194 domain-containing protein [Paracoccaceae bacterium]
MLNWLRNLICGLPFGALAMSQPAMACDTALLLAIDVSSSIDAGEYRIQIDGLADALLDPEVVDALVLGQSALAVVQWSGVNKQGLVLGWDRMTSIEAVRAFSAQARSLPRAFFDSDTAIGDAIAFSARQFEDLADCNRRVIDVSGDGPQNAGSSAIIARQSAEAQGIIINGIAIESIGVAMTNYYKRTIVTRDGFVIRTRGHLEYPRAIREKILRELAKATG